MRVGILSVVPSPYQRDLFRALASQPEVEIEVAYLEDAAPDSPWPHEPLASYESILPGWTLGHGRVRCHCNHQLPDPCRYDTYIVNSPLTALTTQRMFRRLRQHPNWLFWGEILRDNTGVKRLIQSHLAKPIGTAKGIVGIGSKARLDYQRRFPGRPIDELPYFCNLAEFARQRQRNPIPVFLFCGQMIERKGVDLLIEAFERLRASGTEAKLILAGRETSLARKCHHPDIEIAGFQSPRDLPQLFAQADVFVLPSRHDGWGVVINQAIGAGLPIISTSAVGAAVDLIDHGANGLVIPPGDLDALIDAMRDLAGNARVRWRMSAASKSRAEKLSPESGARRWVTLLENACASC